MILLKKPKRPETKEEQIENLKVLPEKILKGMRLLFICLTIAYLTEGVLTWRWIEYLIKIVVIGMTAILIIIVRKIEKKREREEYEARVGKLKEEAKKSLEK